MAVGERVATARASKQHAAAVPLRRGAERIRVGIAGATGYAGGELVRLLARHPNVEIRGLSARGREHDPIAAVHPHLAATELTLDAELPDIDALFLAMPHGASSSIVPRVSANGTAVVDLGPDFRLHEPGAYRQWYGFDHPAPELLGAVVYGLPELHRDDLRDLAARRTAIVASPGCYPTAALLAVAPLARAGIIEDVVIDAKSGVSGAGREAKPEMMFSEANESVRAYGVSGHRHLPEIEQELADVIGANDGFNREPPSVTFIPHLVPMTRGILASAYVRTTRHLDQDELTALFREAYAGEPFVRVTDAPPGTKHVLGSNFCHVHAVADPRRNGVIVFAAIDNLVKGAAGQAVQAFNLVHGLPETAGLEQLPLAP